MLNLEQAEEEFRGGNGHDVGWTNVMVGGGNEYGSFKM